jgi:hypothetical protein
MPAKDGFRLDDKQRLPPAMEPATRQNPKSTICVAQTRAILAALQNDQLLPETRILSNQSGSRLKATC